MADNLMPFSIFLRSLVRALRLPFRKLRPQRSISATARPSISHLSQLPNCPATPKPPSSIDDPSSKTMVCHLDTALLRTPSWFPYFMLVAFEGGGLLRALLLLLAAPFLHLLGDELRLKVMVFLSFCGLKQKGFNLGRSVLPKFFLEDVDLASFRVLMSAKKRVVFSCLPRVMIQGVLSEHLDVEVVVGSELHSVGGYFTGLIQTGGEMGKMVAVLKKTLGETKADVGLENVRASDYQWLSCCEEAYMMGGTDKSTVLPREMYPRPLIFHDGRLAFRPTPAATLVMFLWLPLGFLLAIFRMLVGLILPYNMAYIVGSLSGLSLELKQHNHKDSPSTQSEQGARKNGNLYVCTHRTLLDPIYLATALKRPITAVTYSLSRFSEIMAPIRTVRLTRDRVKDGEKMKKMLSKGDLAVCPEGTTCREPYLLRFSPLFAELTDDIVPVAINVSVSMFYGTTASGLKCLDPIFFLMNPFPRYHMEIFEKLPAAETCGGGNKTRYEVANNVQKVLGEALGFECTMLTRKEKYMVLAGNEGIVQRHNGFEFELFKQRRKEKKSYKRS